MTFDKCHFHRQQPIGAQIERWRVGQDKFRLVNEAEGEVGWWARQDSNLRQRGYEPRVLTAELQALSGQLN